MSSYRSLKAKFPRAKFLLAGDATTHVSFLVDHPDSCTCSHCRQSGADKRAELLVAEAGLCVKNPTAPTHDSGTVIDLALMEAAERSLLIDVDVEFEPIASSDHRLVVFEVNCLVNSSSVRSFQVIKWGTVDQWSIGLAQMKAILSTLEQGIELTLHHAGWKPQQCCGTVPKKLRRLILDACAWSRDAVYVLTGHSLQAVQFSRSVTKRRRDDILG